MGIDQYVDIEAILIFEVEIDTYEYSVQSTSVGIEDRSCLSSRVRIMAWLKYS